MNAFTNNGQTALGIARRDKHPSIISYLQSLGAIDDGIVDDEEDIDDVLLDDDFKKII
jgi:hypothetical protein